MKIKSLFAILLALTLFTCTLVIPTNAKGSIENDKNIEIIINDEVSAETKTKIENHFVSGEPENIDNETTYGLTCTLLGHKLEGTTVETITHKVRTSVPKCLKKTYDYEACTRCDYDTSTLIKSEYIYCCS